MSIAPVPLAAPPLSVPQRRHGFASSPALLVLLFSLAVPGSAVAQIVVSAGGGHFEPWEGEGGYEVRGSILGQIGERDQFRVGGEIAYREFDSDFLGVSGVETQAFRVGGIFHYILVPDFFLQPYVGVKIDLAVNVIDEDAVEEEKPDLDVTGVGTGVGVGGIAGLDVALGDHFALFGEVVVGVDAQLVDKSDEIDVENIGGVSGVGGVRLKF